MVEANKAVIRRFIDEIINKGELDKTEQYVASDYIEHNPMPDQPPGSEGFKQLMAMFRSAFPDLHISIDDIIAEGDKVVVRARNSGTHHGEFMGIAPTGKRYEMQEIHIIRLSGGKMVEHWGLEDNMGMMQQLGVASSQG